MSKELEDIVLAFSEPSTLQLLCKSLALLQLSDDIHFVLALREMQEQIYFVMKRWQDGLKTFLDCRLTETNR